MIDVHCHLADNKFKTDVDLVIAEAQSMGVEKMVAVAEFPSQFETIIELVSKHQGVVYGGIGVHPIQKRNKSVKLKHLDEIETFLTNHHQNSGIVCVGEIGIDHTEDQFKLTPADLVVQEEVFRRQIQLSRHFQLPINVHSRSAAKRTIEILNSEDVGNSSQVILHAFDGNIEDARNALNHDYFFSIPPSFRGSQRAAQIIDEIPMSQILLETDAPALGPHKGQRNEPKNLRICAEIVAEIKNEKIDKIIESTTKNAKKLFKI